MKKTAILLLFAGAVMAQPPETQITDNITAAFGGGVVNGSLVLTWPQFTYGGVTIAQSPSPGKTYAVVGGAVNLALVPTDHAPGYYYTAALTVSGHTVSAIWSVPTLPSPQCSHSTYCTVQEVTVAAVTPAGVTINASQIGVGSSTNGQVICNVNGLVGWCTGGGANAVWGAITGTLSSQTDLAAALAGKQATLGFTPANVASNLSDLANVATARTNLGLSIGVNVEAWSANLDLWSAKTPPTGTAVGTTDAQTLTNKTLDGVTPTVMGYLDVTSSIQTQLNGKQATLGYTPANVASNLSDLANEAMARTNLGVAIGSNVEAWSANLDLLSAKTPPTGAVVGTTDSQTLTNKTLDGVTPTVMGYLDATSSIQTQLNGKQATLGYTPANVASNLSDLANEASARTNLGVAIGSNVEAWSANLDVWSGKTSPSGTVVGTSDAQTLGSKTLASPSLGSGQSPITQTWTVGTGGVTQYTLVDKDSSNPSKIVSDGALGVAMATVSAAGTVEVAEYGEVNCLTDTGGATAGDLAIVGTVTANYCKDSGVTSSSAISIGSRVIGVFRSSAIAGATALIELRPAHFGTQITGASLPAPTASTLGGIESIASLAHNWIAYIDTSGVPHQSQPAFTDISGTAANAQIPAPTISALGGIEAASAATSNSFVTYVDTSGIQHVAQPAISGISGLGSGVATLLATFSTANLATALSATPLYGGNNCGTANRIPYMSSAGVVMCDSGLTYAGNGGVNTHTLSALGTTPADAILMTNPTPAAVGAQQISPSLHASGRGWMTALALPGAPTAATPTAGGSCTAGSHVVAVTFLDAAGETTTGTASGSQTCVTSTGQTIPLTAVPLGPSTGGVTSRNVYMSKAGTTTPFFLVGSISDNTTTTYSVTVADSSLTVSPPGSNGTAGSVPVDAYMQLLPVQGGSGAIDSLVQLQNGLNGVRKTVAQFGSQLATCNFGSGSGPGMWLFNGSATATNYNLCTVSGYLFVSGGSSGGLSLSANNSTLGMSVNTASVGLPSNFNFGFISGTAGVGNAIQTGICQQGPLVLEVGGSPCGTTASLWATGFRWQNPYSVGGTILPLCASGTLGYRYLVSDATLATPGSTYVGNSTVTIAVQCTFNSSGSVYTWIID